MADRPQRRVERFAADSRAEGPALPAWLFLGVALAAALAHLLQPTGAEVQAWIYSATHLAMVGAVVAGIVLHRPRNPSVWWLIVGSQVFYAAANLAWYLGPEASGGACRSRRSPTCCT